PRRSRSTADRLSPLPNMPPSRYKAQFSACLSEQVCLVKLVMMGLARKRARDKRHCSTGTPRRFSSTLPDRRMAGSPVTGCPADGKRRSIGFELNQPEAAEEGSRPEGPKVLIGPVAR